MSKEWKEDCMKYWKTVLYGKYAHWCLEWDELPIDETCTEFAFCNCFEETKEFNQFKELHKRNLINESTDFWK
jgi:hypothetical protein